MGLKNADKLINELNRYLARLRSCGARIWKPIVFVCHHLSCRIVMAHVHSVLCKSLEIRMNVFGISNK